MKVFSLVFCLLSCSVYSQKILICDSLTKKPIQFANIKSEEEGFYSDLNGIAVLPLDSKIINISHISYHPKKIESNKILDTIFLLERTITLDEIIVKNNKIDTFKFGFKKRDDFLSSFPLNPKNELIMSIEPTFKFKELKICSIEIPLNKIKHYNNKDKKIKNKTSIFRINIYTEINKKLELVYQSKFREFIMSKREKINFTLLDDNIIIKANKFFISIEMVGNIDSSGNFVGDNEFVRPIITSEIDENYKSKTFLKSSFNNNIADLYELNEVNKHLSESFKNYKERNLNLSIGIVAEINKSNY